MEIIKIIVPMIGFALLIVYRIYNKQNNPIVLIIIFQFIMFSANFAFIFRELNKILLFLITFIFLFTVAREKRLFFPYYLGFMVVYIFFIILSWVTNLYELKRHDLIIKAFINILSIFATNVVLFNHIKTKKQLIEMLDFLSKLGFLLAVFSIIEYSLLHTRTEVTFANPNYLAYVLTITFIYYLNFPKRFKFIILPVVLLGILFTGSRIAFAISGFAIFVSFLKLDISFLKKISILLVSAISLIFIISFTSKFRPNTKSSDIARIGIMYVSKNIILNKPIFGIGYSQFRIRYKEYLLSNMYHAMKHLYFRKEVVTHNDYLRIVDELGIPALLFMLLILFSAMYILNKRDKDEFVLFLYVLSNMLFSATHNNMNSLLFWFFTLLPFHYKYLGFDKQ